MVKIMQSKYRNAWSHVRVNGTFNDDFLAQVGLHQGLVLSPFLFIIVLEAIYWEIRSACSELLSAEELVLEKHLRAWKKTRSLKRITGVKRSKGFRLNVQKTKTMTSSENATKIIVKGKLFCAAHRKGVESNFRLHHFCRC